MKKKLLITFFILLTSVVILNIGVYIYNEHFKYSEIVRDGIKVVEIIHNATEEIRGGARVVSERGTISASDWKFIMGYLNKHEILLKTTTPEKYGYTGTEQKMYNYLLEKVVAGYTVMTTSFARGDVRMGTYSLDDQYEIIEEAMRAIYLADTMKE